MVGSNDGEGYHGRSDGGRCMLFDGSAYPCWGSSGIARVDLRPSPSPTKEGSALFNHYFNRTIHRWVDS